MDKWPTKTMGSGYDHVPKAFRDEADPAAADVDVDVDVVLELQRAAVVLMIAEVAQNADIVGQEGDSTVYLLHLGTSSADVLAALAADMVTIKKEVEVAAEAELDEGLEFGEFTSDEGLDSGEFEDEPC